jgi:hypothetical protein
MHLESNRNVWFLRLELYIRRTGPIQCYGWEYELDVGTFILPYSMGLTTVFEQCRDRDYRCHITPRKPFSGPFDSTLLIDHPDIILWL